MSRRYGEPVDVRRGDEAPDQFLWAGRLYLVRAVLAHWLETGAWWRSAAAAAVLGTGASAGVVNVLGRDAGTDGHGSHGGGGRFPTPARTASPLLDRQTRERPSPGSSSPVGPPGCVEDAEVEYWRVEASAGRASGTGVYDLSFDWSSAAWSVARVLD